MTVTLAGITFACNSSETYNVDKYRVEGEHEATYVFISNSDNDRESNVAAAAGCPAIGDASTIMTGAICISREISEVDWHKWEVRARFTQNYATEPSTSAPWGRSPEVSWSSEIIELPIFEDAAGDAITNSAGFPFNNVTGPFSVAVVTISRYETAFVAATILAYGNHVNNATFMGAAAGQCLCSGISAASETQQGTAVWKVTYQFKFMMLTDGWKLKLLDFGECYWSGAVGSGDPVNFASEDNGKLLGPLNGSGGKGSYTTPTFITFERYEEANFSTLGLT